MGGAAKITAIAHKTETTIVFINDGVLAPRRPPAYSVHR